MPVGVGGGRAVDVDVAVAIVHLTRHSEVRLGQIATASDVALPIDDDHLLVHAVQHPARMSQVERVVGADVHAFVAQIGEHILRDATEAAIDDHAHVADAAATPVTKELQHGQRDAVVARHEVEQRDLLLGLPDQIDARLRRLAIVIEDADDVRAHSAAPELRAIGAA